MPESLCTQVAPHLRVEVFRRYEAVIAQAVEAHPKNLEVVPVGVAMTTFAARLRDAINSYSKYRWETSLFKDEDFNRVIEDNGLVVRGNVQGKVVVGPRTSSATPIESVSSVSGAERNFWLELHKPGSDLLKAAAYIRADGLGGPVKITGMSLEEVLEQTSTYDVAAFVEKNYIILL